MAKVETTEIAKRFKGFDGIIGDLNLNPAFLDQKSKLLTLCGREKIMALEELTTIYNSQLEHVILEKVLSEKCFATSFFNLGSDHKSIAVRFGKYPFTKQFNDKFFFDFIHHLKSRSNIEELGENYGMKNYRQKPDNGNSKRN